MITIAICDDNVDYLRNFALSVRKIYAKSLSEEYINDAVIEFSHANDILHYLKKFPIDILFLDIDMPQTNGFELAEKLNRLYPDVIIIFVSSHENFVYSSFEYSPFRFLRKSHIDDELRDTFIKAVDKCLTLNDIMTFNTVDGDISLKAKDILYFEGNKNYYYIYTLRNVYKCRGTLLNVEKLTENFCFFRIHSAFIVNMENIETVIDRLTVQMTNKKILPISQKRAAEFKRAYMNFIRKRFLK